MSNNIRFTKNSDCVAKVTIIDNLEQCYDKSGIIYKPVTVLLNSNNIFCL